MREFNYLHADLTQVAESTVQMRRDLVNVEGDFLSKASGFY